MSKWAFVFLAIVYGVTSRLSGFFLVAYGREIELGVESIWFMDIIIISDGPVTIIYGRNVCSGIVTTTSFCNL